MPRYVWILVAGYFVFDRWAWRSWSSPSSWPSSAGWPASAGAIMGDAAEERRRAAWGYEPNTPVCATCSKYRKARITPKGRIEPPFCAGGKFAVHASGCCDRWKDRKTGEWLEG